MNRTTAILLGLLAALPASPAAAVTRCVKPTGTPSGNPCYSLISYAVAASTAGDVISVAPGVYRETSAIAVANTLTGLRVMGPSTAIVDNEIQAGIGYDGFDVSATDVVIQGLTIRNGGHGIRVNAGADRVQVIGVTMNGNFSTCLRIDANDAVVKGSRFYGCSYAGIEDYGRNVTVTSSTFRAIDCYALYLEGSAGNSFDAGTLTFSHNLVANSFCAAVYAVGTYNGSTAEPGVQSAVIQGNIVSNTNSYGFYVANQSGNSAGTVSVTANKISNVYKTAIYLDNMGANTVTTNNIKSAREGIEVFGPGATTILSNVVAGVTNTAIVLSRYVGSGNPDYSTIKSNKLTPDTYATGIWASRGVSMTISGNTIAQGDVGILTDHTNLPVIVANTIANTRHDGISVTCENAAGDAASCFGATIGANRITGTQGDIAVFFYGYGAGFGPIQITNNVVKNANFRCFQLYGDNIQASHNQGLVCGNYPNNYGFEINGIGSILTGNTIRYSASDGFHVIGPNATLTSNIADHNSEDGIDIHGDSAVLQGNRATFNAGTGIEIEAGSAGPSGSLNVATGNAIDLCDAGTSTTMTGTFPTSAHPAACDEASGYIGD